MEGRLPPIAEGKGYRTADPAMGGRPAISRAYFAPERSEGAPPEGRDPRP